MTTRAPALFVGHGSPMNAIEDTPSAIYWARLGRTLAGAKPRAIVVVSAHWVTDGVRVMSNAQPRTIHDFGRSFPQALFDVEYPAPGDPDLANTIVETLRPFVAQLDDSWGLDHGAWSVLLRLFPDADVPVVQVSLDARRSPAEHYAIGRALSALRDDNVLLLGSGNIVHNLRAFFHAESPDPEQWVHDFNAEIVMALQNNHQKVIDYQKLPDAAIAAPDWEHFAPVLYVLGAQRENEAPVMFNSYASPGITMHSFALGVGA